MANANNAENSTLYPRKFYAFYIGPNNNGISHLIFRPSTKQILTTMKYKPVPVSKNLFKTINKKIHLPPKFKSINLKMTVLSAKIIISMIPKMMVKLEVTK